MLVSWSHRGETRGRPDRGRQAIYPAGLELWYKRSALNAQGAVPAFLANHPLLYADDAPCTCLPLFPVRRDSHIRMWNLLKGRCSYTAKLEVEGEGVSFTPGGDAYVLVCGNKVRCGWGKGKVRRGAGSSRYSLASGVPHSLSLC